METQNLEPEKDTILAKYIFEMNNDGNDGWTKQHYKELYEKRLADLELLKTSINNYLLVKETPVKPLGEDLG